MAPSTQASSASLFLLVQGTFDTAHEIQGIAKESHIDLACVTPLPQWPLPSEYRKLQGTWGSQSTPYSAKTDM
ncbi:uncharacterized protein BP01DRAFT_133482 [Aspergillus saccharolyticus JOP 1030-1]|uniref:Uncharacterized protein n=1 Tax=Aspergillus saccharolyticus JOP 1030-1 TaxID=1450539 RepID=A0A318Z5X5_9EURO|nr:hypothetical protein BP01DRAFT_133482 [Aspergillus saccharolyticus JOP 1030-1]PYH42509.1 hypothetical protein BP01DRAFT_133482 [Aspergillus saccharolyticus JOP 1030-1]